MHDQKKAKKKSFSIIPICFFLFSYAHLIIKKKVVNKPSKQNNPQILAPLTFLSLLRRTLTLTPNAQVDLRHMDEQTGSNIVNVGVDLSEFYMSVEWDILEVPAVR